MFSKHCDSGRPFCGQVPPPETLAANQACHIREDCRLPLGLAMASRNSMAAGNLSDGQLHQHVISDRMLKAPVLA